MAVAQIGAEHRMGDQRQMSRWEHEGGASSVIDAAYRFVRHEPGVDVVLFGTGDHEHLKTNIGSLLKPRLPESDRGKLAELFGHLVGVGLDAPHLSRAGRVVNR